MLPFVLIGSFFFAVFGGAGLAFFPIDLISSYVFRPQKPDPAQHVLARKALIDESALLFEQGQKTYELKRDIDINKRTKGYPVSRKKSQFQDSMFNLKTEFLHYEDIYDAFNAQENIIEQNPLSYFAYLVVGCAASAFSVFFVAHTVLSINGLTILVDDTMEAVSRLSPMLGIAVFITFAGYYCTSITKGAIKVLYVLRDVLNSNPVKPGKTYASSFCS